MAGLSNITLAVRANINQFQKRLKVAEKKMKTFGRNMSRAGSNMSQNVTVPLAIAGGAALKAASDYEDAVTEIEKVSNQETAAKLEKQIRKMAGSIPMAQSKLADLAADAARFGVTGSDNVATFTRTVAKMSATTDLAAKEAGKALAKIADQADIPQENIDKLGSTIVRLGDSMATSQSEIVDAMSRGTIAARNFGLQGETIAGLAARVNEVSESGERAGTRIKRLFQELQEPKKVQKVASALGMTVTEFERMKKESPEQALMAVVNAAGQSGDAGARMANIFATSSRSALRGLASDSDALAQALGKAGSEFEKPTSLSRQFAKEQRKFSSQLQIALNKLRNIGITIGNILMPPFLSLLEKLKAGMDFFRGLSDGVKSTIVKITGLVAALGPALFVLGKLTVGISAAVAAFNPVTAAIAAAIAAVMLLITVVRNNMDKFNSIWERTKETVTESASQISDSFSKTGDSAEQLGLRGKDSASVLETAWVAVQRGVMNVVDRLGGLFNGLAEIVSNFVTGVTGLVNFFVGAVTGDFDKMKTAVKDIFGSMFDSIITAFQTVVDGLLSSASAVVGVFNKDWANAIDNARQSVRDFSDDLKILNDDLEDSLKKTARVASFASGKVSPAQMLGGDKGGGGDKGAGEEEAKKNEKRQEGIETGQKYKEMLDGLGDKEKEIQKKSKATGKTVEEMSKKLGDVEIKQPNAKDLGRFVEQRQQRKKIFRKDQRPGEETREQTKEEQEIIKEVGIDVSDVQTKEGEKKARQEAKKQKQKESTAKTGKAIGSAANKLTQGAEGAKKAVTEGASMLANSIAPGLGKAVKPVMKLLGKDSKQLKKTISKFAEMIPKFIVKIVKNVPVLIKAIVRKVPMIIQSLVKALPIIINAILKAIPTIINAFVEMLPKLIAPVLRILVNNIPKIIKAFIMQIPKIVVELVKAIPQIIKAIFSGGGDKEALTNEQLQGMQTKTKNKRKELKTNVSGDDLEFVQKEDEKEKERMGQTGG